MIRKAVLLLQLLVCAIGTYAQHWIEIDWDSQKIDSVIPVYTEVIPLPSDFAQYSYSASLEYPEFEPLSASEVTALKRILTSGQGARTVLDEMPRVESSVGVARRMGQLDLVIQPVVYREGKYQRLLNAKVVLNKELNVSSVRRVASTGTSGRYAEHSVLASGKWVKISVPSDGVYCLTTQQLASMGFNDPSRVKLYGYGGHYQTEKMTPDSEYDDLEEVPLYRGASQGLLFYGNGPVSWGKPSTQSGVTNVSTRIRNFYSDAGYYFLTEGDDPMAFTKEPSLVVGSVINVTTTRSRVLYEKDEYSWYIGGRDLYETLDYGSSSPRTITLSTPFVASTDDAILQVSMAASAKAASSISAKVDGTTLSNTQKIDALTTYRKAVRGDLIAKVSIGGADVTSVVPTVSTTGSARLDYVALDYSRKLALSDVYPYVTFSSTASVNRKYSITEAAAGTTVVWRLGTPGVPAVQMEGTTEDGVYSFIVKDYTSQDYVAVNTASVFPSPTVVGTISNQDLHADEGADLVIIVPESGKLTAQAERLAELHRTYDGLRVRVVSADQLYNEFSSGTPDATAYRRYLKMLYDRAENVDEAPRYLLLFGDCAWDNRMLSSQWTGCNPKDYLLSFQSSESLSETQCYVMEDYFGLLDDGEGSNLLTDKVDVGVGRFPVRTESQAKVMVDHVESYLKNENAGAWKNTICVVADDGNANLHMDDAERVLTTIEGLYPEYRIQKIYFDTYDRTVSATGNSYPGVTSDIKKALDEGVLVLNYTGHGAAYCLSHEQVLNLQDFKNFSLTKLPLWVTAACDVMPFDGQEENIGEQAVLNANGAAIAFYGTARTVISSYNRSMNRSFMRYVLGKDSGNKRYTMGDAVRLAKNALCNSSNADGSDQTVNKLHFALLGDPALTLAAPTYKVVVDALNGMPVDEEANDENLLKLSAGSIAQVSGHIEDENGRRQDAFQGTVTTSVYDSKSDITCKNNDGSATSKFTFSTYDKQIFSGTDNLQDGTFSISFPVPLDLNYTDARGLIDFYAVNSDRTLEAHDGFDAFILGGTNESWTNDGVGPEITLALNADGFVSGGSVGTTAVLLARIEDADGINTAGSGLGHDIELVIDNATADATVLNNYFNFDFGSYTAGSIEYTLPTLTPGYHTLSLRAWDVFNNPTVARLNFEVLESDGVFDVSYTQNPVHASTTFILSVHSGTVQNYSLSVYDLSGRKLSEEQYAANGTEGYYTMKWNATASRFTDGVYLFKVGVQDANNGWSYKILKMVVRPRN